MTEEQINAALRSAGDQTPVRAVRAMGGGCINHARRVETERGVYLLKTNPSAPAGMFAAEARGLALLRAVGAVRVPQVLAQDEGMILLEFIDGGGSRAWDQAALGEALAALHRAPTPSPAYGLDHDNFIGPTPQPNGWQSDWVAFFRERRLRPQVELAARGGRLPLPRRRGLERVMERLEELLGGVERRPSLLHGDLWAGNVLAAEGGAPALIDPAIYYGDREAEIAYTQLFGGFSTAFYRAYQAAWPLDPGFDRRRGVYNLYHLLNHLNLFGEGYGEEVDAVIEMYT